MYAIHSLARKRQSWFRWQTGYCRVSVLMAAPTQHHLCLWKDVFLHRRSFTWVYQTNGGFRAHVLLNSDRGCPIKPQDCIVIIWKPQGNKYISSDDGVNISEGRSGGRGQKEEEWQGNNAFQSLCPHSTQGTVTIFVWHSQVRSTDRDHQLSAPATAKAKEVRGQAESSWKTHSMTARGNVCSQCIPQWITIPVTKGANQTFFGITCRSYFYPYQKIKILLISLA